MVATASAGTTSTRSSARRADQLDAAEETAAKARVGRLERHADGQRARALVERGRDVGDRAGHREVGKRVQADDAAEPAWTRASSSSGTLPRTQTFVGSVMMNAGWSGVAVSPNVACTATTTPSIGERERELTRAPEPNTES
jgi:hypothetical protein